MIRPIAATSYAFVHALTFSNRSHIYRTGCFDSTTPFPAIALRRINANRIVPTSVPATTICSCIFHFLICKRKRCKWARGQVPRTVEDFRTHLNLTYGSNTLFSGSFGRLRASTKTIVTTELQICDLSLFDVSARRGFRWKYWRTKISNYICTNQIRTEFWHILVLYLLVYVATGSHSFSVRPYSCAPVAKDLPVSPSVHVYATIPTMSNAIVPIPWNRPADPNRSRTLWCECSEMDPQSEPQTPHPTPDLDLGEPFSICAKGGRSIWISRMDRSYLEKIGETHIGKGIIWRTKAFRTDHFCPLPINCVRSSDVFEVEKIHADAATPLACAAPLRSAKTKCQFKSIEVMVTRYGYMASLT